MIQHHPRLRAGLAACALLLAAGTARAQYAFDDAIMPPRAVAWRLADRGFTGIGRPRFDGRAYVVEAFGPSGARMRLFVDAQDGAILGRQHLDAPPMAVARPAPGYGWTEEDELRGPMRQAERLRPPADIPMPESRGVPLRRPYDPETGLVRSDGSIGTPRRAAIDPNAQGLNPDARGGIDAPRRVARVGNAVKPPDGKAQTRTVPEAPKLRPAETAKPEAKPEAPVAAIEQPKPQPLPGATPAAIQPPAAERVVKPAEAIDTKPVEVKPVEARTVEAKPAAAKPAEPNWKDPPEGKRNVRVIGGATLVPGIADKEPAAQ